MTGLRVWGTDVALRAVKTGAQTAVALLAANTAGLTSVSWGNVLDVAGLAIVVTVLHNLAALNVNGNKPAHDSPAEPPAGVADDGAVDATP